MVRGMISNFPENEKMTNRQLAYLFARTTLGINLFIHGLVRIPKLSRFAEGVIKGFEASMLPDWLISPFVYAIPFIELIAGFCILLGILTRKALSLAAILIIFLIAGSAFKEDWSAVSTQMLYALFIFFLISNLKNEVWAVSRKRND